MLRKKYIDAHPSPPQDSLTIQYYPPSPVGSPGKNKFVAWLRARHGKYVKLMTRIHKVMAAVITAEKMKEHEESTPNACCKQLTAISSLK